MAASLLCIPQGFRFAGCGDTVAIRPEVQLPPPRGSQRSWGLGLPHPLRDHDVSPDKTVLDGSGWIFISRLLTDG